MKASRPAGVQACRLAGAQVECGASLQDVGVPGQWRRVCSSPHCASHRSANGHPRHHSVHTPVHASAGKGVGQGKRQGGEGRVGSTK